MRQVVEENVLRTQEISPEELEMALLVVHQAQRRTSPLEPILIPSELKRLNPLDWEIVGSLLEALVNEKARSRLH